VTRVSRCQFLFVVRRVLIYVGDGSRRANCRAFWGMGAVPVSVYQCCLTVPGRTVVRTRR
jgi:hypothetical protein